MQHAWRAELLALLGWVLVALSIGYLVGYPWLGLTLGLMLALGQQLRELRKLAKWIELGFDSNTPDAKALWGKIFDALHMQQRNNQNTQQLQLRQIRELQAMTTALPDATVALDAQGHITWCNATAVHLLGLQQRRDLGQPLLNLVRHPKLAEVWSAPDRETELLIPSPNQPDIQLALRVTRYGYGQRLLIARDVTRVTRMEQVRREFVANASHELRTPLTVLSGYLEMLETNRESEALKPWQGSIREMHQQATRMVGIIDDMLRLARLEGTAVQGSREERVNVSQIVQTVVEEARALSAGKHTIQTEVDESCGLWGHPAELHSIIANLVVNAVRYTPNSGQITIRWWSDRFGVHLSVTDTGIGIASQHLERLTERFYRVDAGRSRDTGGTGLGLAIVKHAIEHHEGRLEIRSQLGQGSTFSAHFPIARRRDFLPT